MKTKISVALATLLTAFATSNAQALTTIGSCPTVGLATSCAVVYTFNADGSISTAVNSSIPSTDGIEDTLAGIVNNSGHTINSLTLDGGSLDIFGFDGDGISTVPNPGSGPGNTYFGQYFDATNHLLGTTTFSGINATRTKGTINFSGLTNGGTGWFVLEEQISFSAPPTPTSTVPEPETYALMLAGLSLVGFASRRRKLS